MKLHGNAALSFRQRERMVRRVVDHGWSVREAALAAEVSARTAGKWVARYRAEGVAGLLDRSSAPLFVANRSSESTIEAIAALRRLRFTGPEISEVLELPGSTVSGILKRIGMGRLGRLGMEPAERYERTVAGELIHIDVKKVREDPRRRWEADHGHQAQPAEDTRRPRWGQSQGDWLGVRARRHRRRDASGLRRGPPGREGHHSDWVLAQGDRVLRASRHAGPGTDHR